MDDHAHDQDMDVCEEEDSDDMTDEEEYSVVWYGRCGRRR
jgi:hypothetical protein